MNVFWSSILVRLLTSGIRTIQFWGPIRRLIDLDLARAPRRANRPHVRRALGTRMVKDRETFMHESQY